MSLIKKDGSGEPEAMLVEASTPAGGVTLINSYRTLKHSPEDLVALATEIQKADSFTRARVSSKLQMIVQQVRFLQQQAIEVLQEARDSADLHRVSCNFVKQPGNAYHLYRRSTGQRYFSMLSPQEWGECPHEHLGTFRLEADQSWTLEEDLSDRDAEQQLLDKILKCGNAFEAVIDKC